MPPCDWLLGLAILLRVSSRSAQYVIRLGTRSPTVRTKALRPREPLERAQMRPRPRREPRRWKGSRIQLDALDLHQPDIMPGLVTHAYAEQCHTPSGCIDAVLPEKAVEMIVKFMNLRREARVARSFTKMADETRKRRKVAAGREKAVAAKKGRPGVYGGGRVVKKKLEVATQVQSVRVGSKRKRKRPLHDIPLWSEPITTSGFKRFLAVWVYAADIGVKEIKKLWNTNERRQKKETKAIKGKKFQRAYRVPCTTLRGVPCHVTNTSCMQRVFASSRRKWTSSRSLWEIKCSKFGSCYSCLCG